VLVGDDEDAAGDRLVEADTPDADVGRGLFWVIFNVKRLRISDSQNVCRRRGCVRMYRWYPPLSYNLQCCLAGIRLPMQELRP